MDPVASVVVATYNRAALLPRLVEALGAQEGVGRFEVIIVDDASTDDTWSTLTTLAETHAVNLRPIRLDRNGGPARARNVGWRAAAADVVCFTDDDCVPQPKWLAALLTAGADADIVQGRTLPDPGQSGQRGPFSRTITVPHEQGFYETCNIAYPRQLLEALGGFDDEAFGFDTNGEDSDLAWRGREAGATTAFAADALVFHDVWPSNYWACVRELRRRNGMVLMFKRHPQMRRFVEKGIFYRPTHWTALLAAAAGGAALTRPTSIPRLAGAASAGLWYAWQVRRHRAQPPKRWQWAKVVPQSLVLDLAEVAVLARASLRHRTLVL